MDKRIICLTLIFLGFISACTTAEKPHEVQKTSVTTNTPQTLRYKRFNDAESNNLIAAAWRQTRSENYAAAARAFEAILDSGKSHTDVYYGAGLNYFKYYDIQKALKYLSFAISLTPEHFEALYLRAQIYREMKNYIAARKDLEKILSLEKCPFFINGESASDHSSELRLRLLQQDSRKMIKLN